MPFPKQSEKAPQDDEYLLRLLGRQQYLNNLNVKDIVALCVNFNQNAILTIKRP